MVAVVALARTAEVGRNSSFKVDVGLDVAIVSVADDHAGAAVVSTAREGHANRCCSVIFHAHEVFRLVRSLFGLDKLYVRQCNYALKVTRIDPNTDSVGCAGYDRADAAEAGRKGFARSGRKRNHHQFHLTAHPCVVREFPLGQGAAELH